MNFDIEETMEFNQQVVDLLTSHDNDQARYILDQNISINNFINIANELFDEIIESSNNEPNQKNDNIELVLKKQDFKKLNNKECSICCLEFKKDENISILNCNHEFHHDCIREWGKHKTNCPICRKNIPYEDNAPNNILITKEDVHIYNNNLYNSIINNCNEEEFENESSNDDSIYYDNYEDRINNGEGNQNGEDYF